MTAALRCHCGLPVRSCALCRMEDRESSVILKRLCEQIAESRRALVIGTPEKYPAAELRGFTILEAEALGDLVLQLQEQVARLISAEPTSGGR